jgi:hypothetical protein
LQQSVEELSQSMQALLQSTQDMLQNMQALLEASRVAVQGAVHSDSDGRDQTAQKKNESQRRVTWKEVK